VEIVVKTRDRQQAAALEFIQLALEDAPEALLVVLGQFPDRLEVHRLPFYGAASEGGGQIDVSAFRRILNRKEFSTLPMVLETPKGEDDEFAMDLRNLAALRNLIA